MRLQRRFGLPVRRMRRVPGIRRMQGQKEAPGPGRIAGAKQLLPSKIGVITARIECRVALSKRLRPYSPGWGVLKRSDGEGRPCGKASRRRTALGKVPATAALLADRRFGGPGLAPADGNRHCADGRVRNASVEISHWTTTLSSNPSAVTLGTGLHVLSSSRALHTEKRQGYGKGSESHAAPLPLRVVRSNQRKGYFSLNFFPSGSVASRSRLFSEQILATVVP